MAVQLSEHLQTNSLPEPYQAAYRARYSVETALIRIQSDVLMTMDRHDAVFPVLLDLSAAFDTIDHELLLQTLKERFGITGQAL